MNPIRYEKQWNEFQYFSNKHKFELISLAFSFIEKSVLLQIGLYYRTVPSATQLWNYADWMHRSQTVNN